MNKDLLKIQNISFGYLKNDPLIISDFSLSIKKGSFSAILGPNGAGKSTILKISAGLLDLTSGDVFVNGLSLRKYDRKKLSKTIAFLPQEMNNWYDITVFEYVLQGRYPYLTGMGFSNKKDITVCERNIDLCGVSNFKNRHLSELSGGEKQRVRLASILSQEPEILILDEPTSFLDIHNELDFFSILKDLSNNGTSVLMATHNINLASLYCNELVLMNKGNIVKKGKAEDVLTQRVIDKVYGNGFTVNTHPETGVPILYPDFIEGRV